MRLPFVLAVCLSCHSSPDGAQDAFKPSSAESQFQAECTLTPEIVERVLLDSQSDEPWTCDAARAILDEHEAEHGWSLWLEGPDYVDDAHSVRCSDAVLDKLAALHCKDARSQLYAPHQAVAKALGSSHGGPGDARCGNCALGQVVE